MSSQRVKRKLQMPPDSQELRNKLLMPNQNDAEVEDAGHEPIEVLLRMFKKLSVISGRQALVKMNQIVVPLIQARQMSFEILLRDLMLLGLRGRAKVLSYLELPNSS